MPAEVHGASRIEYAAAARYLECNDDVGVEVYGGVELVECCSFASLLCCLVVCYHYMTRPQYRRTPGWLMLRSTLCEGLMSAMVLLLLQFQRTHASSAVVTDTRSESATDDLSVVENYLDVVIATILSSEVASSTWLLIMSSHLLIIYRNPFNPDRHRSKYLFVIVVSAAINFSLCVFVRKHYQGVKLLHILECGLYLAPFVIHTLAGGIVHIMVKWMIRVRQQEGFHSSISFLSRERAMHSSEVYLLLHGSLHLVGLVLVGIQLAAPCRIDRKTLWTCLVYATCLRPSVSLFGWFWVNKWGRISMATIVEQVQSQRRRLSLPVRRPPQYDHAEGVSMTVMRRPSSPEPARDLPRGGTSAAARGLAPTREGDEAQRMLSERGFKQELRFELIYDVACSIGDCAKVYLDLNNNEDDDSDGDTRPVIGANSMIVLGTNLRSNLPDGRFGKGEGPSSTALRELAATATRRTLVDSGGVSTGAGDLAGYSGRRDAPDQGMSVRARADHCDADTFQRIRRLFGISRVVYAKAFPNDLNQADTNWQQKLKESVSEGASGSFFYRVMSGSTSGVPSQFIVKQINPNEKRVLVNMLPAYHAHVSAQQGRSLIQYLGCHSLALRWKFSAQVHFCVMRNFLPVKMWMIFDLKGATANRRALTANVLLASTKNTTQNASGYGTLRDWEWMDTAMGVDVDSADKERLADMVAADSKFLADQGLLDYSLLVGVHRLSRDSPPAERKKEIAQLREAGGFPSIDRQKVYFFGIIDVLERYTWGWWAQHWVLTIYYYLSCQRRKADGISALAPREYADRFNTFMQREVLQVPLPAESDSSPPSENPWAARPSRPRGGRRSKLQSDQRWGQLWMRRRRGLITERLQAERSDYIRHIEDLHNQLRQLRERLGEAESVA